MGHGDPLESSGNPLVGMERVFMLVLAKPGEESAICWKQLRARLTLTDAEAMVLARLMCGDNLSKIADHRGSSYETVHAKEKALRAKLDCDNRAALLARGWWAIAVIPNLATTSNED